MTDAHCHVPRGETRHFLCDPTDAAPGVNDCVFYGRHPWDFLQPDADLSFIPELAARLDDNPAAGVGEIGLDRLKVREIPSVMRAAFAAQLRLAAEKRRPVVLHGAKCWGEVVKACRPYAGQIPGFLFHGFSRAGGLLPEIVALNGFISVGPAVLNNHAVNYRELVKAIPLDRLLVESDATAANTSETPSVTTIAARLAALRGQSLADLHARLEANAIAFMGRSSFQLGRSGCQLGRSGFQPL